jgi:hypothetical protein
MCIKKGKKMYSNWHPTPGIKTAETREMKEILNPTKNTQEDKSWYCHLRDR